MTCLDVNAAAQLGNGLLVSSQGTTGRRLIKNAVQGTLSVVFSSASGAVNQECLPLLQLTAKDGTLLDVSLSGLHGKW